MKKVALTGNIGSGKSIVASMFSVFGISIFNADSEARKVYGENEVKDKMISIFSNVILNPKGEIDTKKVASIIFNDKEALKIVNSIIHPIVLEKYNNWCSNHNSEIYTIHEAAIIFENNLQKKFDVVINVSAPLDIRIKRVMERDNTTEELVRERMANQLSDKVKCELSQFVVYNDGKNFLIPQVNLIHKKLISDQL
ncbi:MAG TPA: dephospho-CoA kinase [Bacteroidales bacterium]|jgi:dephospho-CoA kinase|nr:dephospho-CoA kinase [Bacteroidota bacterium]HJN05529.1 dephospho-CoA kinase [Bacteroidales bacterium]|tara:strand:+ start:38 stop:628 length:591 start_codon:yes stop_codon:yes gene_type:complete